MAKYFIYKNGKQEGPYEAKAVIDMKLSPDTFVWCEGMTDWKPISQVPELQQPQQPEPPRFTPQVPPQTPPQAGPQGGPQYQQPQYQQQYQQGPQQYQQGPQQQYQQGPQQYQQGPQQQYQQGPQQQYQQGPQQQYQQAYQQPNNYQPAPSEKSKVTAAILAILIGGFGIHYFYLGKTTGGIVFLLLCCTGIPSLLALIQGIMMLTMTEEQFQQKYVYTESSFPLF